MASIGVEPIRPFGQWILSPSRLPIPPRGRRSLTGCKAAAMAGVGEPERLSQGAILRYRRRKLQSVGCRVAFAYHKLGAGVIGHGVHRGDLFKVLHDAAREAGVAFRLGVTILRPGPGREQIWCCPGCRTSPGPETSRSAQRPNCRRGRFQSCK